MSMFTPWGPAQHRHTIAPGIIEVSTASHGGIHLSPALNAQVHPAWRDRTGWYEEDCEWAIVAVTFPKPFAQQRVPSLDCTVAAYAHDVLRRWMPDQYEQVTGASVTAAESPVRAEQQFAASVRDVWVSSSAWGHGNDSHGRMLVPPGWVGVIAQIGGRWQPAQHRRWFLVPQQEHAAAGPYGMIIDSDRHPTWPALPADPLDRPVTVRVQDHPKRAPRPGPASPGDRHVFPIFGAATPHRNLEVGELWYYPAVGTQPARWRAYRRGDGACLNAYPNTDDALTSVGFRLPPTADPAAGRDSTVTAAFAALLQPTTQP